MMAEMTTHSPLVAHVMLELGINRTGVHATVQRGRWEDTYCTEQERDELVPQVIIPDLPAENSGWWWLLQQKPA